MGQVKRAGKYCKINRGLRRISTFEQGLLGRVFLLAGIYHRGIDIDAAIDCLRIGRFGFDEIKHRPIATADIGDCDRFLRCKLMYQR